jgi:hypothetical protein
MTDIDGSNPENQILDEPRHVEPGLWTRVIVPLHAPFFVNSLVMKKPNGEPLIYDKDYRIHRLMTRLTEHCAEPVACMIELLPEDLTDVMMDYKVVGEFSLIDNSMLQLVTAAIDDDRPVWWENLENKPVVFPPVLHSHSLIRDIIAWQDAIECMDLYLAMKQANGREAVQVRVDHFYTLLTNYITVYGNMLSEYLNNHLGANNAHGLTAAQVNKEKVSNFATATVSNVMQGRKDMHLTPMALETIVETYGFNSEEFLGAALLPLSRFGNTNFIPPSIDGSFEGLGSKSECCAICQEDDGTIVLVGNRLDGRINGLYCSVIKDYQTNTPTQTFSAYRYTHPKFIQDGVNVDMVVQGSGDQAILVGDSVRGQYYIGLTNGTLNPSKHVYCKIDMSQLMQAVTSDPNQKLSNEIHHVSISVIGAWIYIFFTSANGYVDDPDGPYWGDAMNYKYFYRVRMSDIRLLNDLVPQRIWMSYVDMDGVYHGNSPVWQWGTRVVQDRALHRISKYIFPFYPYAFWAVQNYSQHSLAAPNPNNSGTSALKFMSYFYSTNQELGKYAYSNLEVSYEIDPNTNVMTMLSKTPQPTINWYDQNTWLPTNSTWAVMIAGEAKMGLAVLDDLTVIGTGCLTYTGFPWQSKVIKAKGVINRHDFISKTWHQLAIDSYVVASEKVVPPTANSVIPRPPFQFPSGEAFHAISREDSGKLAMYWKNITGKYVSRSNVNNLFIGSVVSRALTNDIRKLNVPPALGGCVVSVPSGDLDRYGIEVGNSAWCMGVQRKYFDRTKIGSAWTDSGGPDDVLVIDTNNLRYEADGSLTVIPTHEILYPAWIVDSLKSQVEFPGVMSASPKVFVSICDPTGNTSGRFGWLPVVVYVTYADLSTFSRRTTMMVIDPVYSYQGARSVVTGFNVLDKVHDIFLNGASEQNGVTWDAWITGANADENQWRDVYYKQAGMRCLYYLNGNAIDVYIDPAIQCGRYSDVNGGGGNIRYDNRDTRRWTSGSMHWTEVNEQPLAVTPDNGITVCWDHTLSTGGAAIIAKGSVNNPMLASVYPEIGWVIFFQAPTDAVFQGRPYTFPAGLIDLRDIDAAPGNKTFYVYAALVNGVPTYQVTTQKRLESLTQLWAATVRTNGTQIITVERLNVFALNGHRITEVKRGNSIPAASGLVNEEGQIPWFYAGEILP